jgi:signal peptidase I
VASAAFLVAWWFTLGPVALGGPATFVVVDGQSMEPVYAVGDLVVARARSEHAPGDIAVFFAPDRRRYVIHRLEERADDGSWLTIGDNNDRRDSWTVPDEAILGTEWFVLPRVGLVLFWVQDHPVRFGAGVAALVVAVSIGGRRRRQHPDLVAALETAHRSPWRADRPIGDLALLGAAVITFAVAIVTIQRLASVRMVGSIQGTIMLALGAISATIGVLLYLRLVEGRGIPEPLASRYTLAGIVWDCPYLPDVATTVDHAGPRSLRRFTDEHTGRILRAVEHDGDVMRETYLTIDPDGVGHRWVVETTITTQDEALLVPPIPDSVASVSVDPVGPDPEPLRVEPEPEPLRVEPEPEPLRVEPEPEPLRVEPEPEPEVTAPALPQSTSRAEIDARFEEILSRLDSMRAGLGSPSTRSGDRARLPARIEPVVAVSQPDSVDPVGADSSGRAERPGAAAASFDDILARLDRLRAGIGA